MSSVSPYPIEVRAQAIALYRLKLNCDHVAQELGLEPRTVQRWVRRYRQVSLTEDDAHLVNQDYAIADMAGEQILDAIEHLDTQGPDAKLKLLVPLNIVRGTSIDKIIKRSDTSKGTQIGVFIISQGNETVDVRTIDAVVTDAT